MRKAEDRRTIPGMIIDISSYNLSLFFTHDPNDTCSFRIHNELSNGTDTDDMSSLRELNIQR